MAEVAALNVNDITKVGIIAIVVIVVVGLLLALIVKALVARIIILVAVVALAVFVWQQRTHVKDQINAHKCDLNATFFGIHLDAPDRVKRACRSHA